MFSQGASIIRSSAVKLHQRRKERKRERESREAKKPCGALEKLQKPFSVCRVVGTRQAGRHLAANPAGERREKAAPTAATLDQRRMAASSAPVAAFPGQNSDTFR